MYGDIPSGRSSLAAHTWGNSMYIMGGYNGSKVLDDFYQLRFEAISIPPPSLSQDLGSLLGAREYADGRVKRPITLLGEIVYPLT